VENGEGNGFSGGTSMTTVQWGYTIPIQGKSGSENCRSEAKSFAIFVNCGVHNENFGRGWLEVVDPSEIS